MRSLKRADNCSVNDWAVVFINMEDPGCTVTRSNTDQELR
jgi:hypothetical protein